MSTLAPQIDGAQLRALTAARRHLEACEAARALVQAGAADREIMYLYALNLRCLGCVAEALQHLELFERQHPAFSRIYQERGHCQLLQGDIAAAIRSFERAVAINDALTDSWLQLSTLYRRRGQTAAAARAARQAAQLGTLPPRLVQAASLFADGDLERSEALLRQCLEQGAPRVSTTHLLARVRHARGAWLDAQCLFEEALERSDLEALRLDYVRLLLDRQRYGAALAQLGPLESRNESAAAKFMRATACLGLGRGAEATRLLQQQVLSDPSPVTWLTLADSLRAAGDPEAAINAYREAAHAGGYAASCWGLANLKRYRFAPAERQAMRDAIAAAPAPEAREALCFALGTALRQAGDYAGAWHSFEAGNALHRAHHPYVVGHDEARVQALIESCDAAFFDARSTWGVTDGDAIFIVGLPRSGSTLVEQILASHPAIDGTRELGELPALVQDLEGRRPELSARRYPALLAELDAPEIAQLAWRYLDSVRAYRHAAPLFTDKLPNNFLHVGLIHLMMPRAKIIDVRRAPLDCCVSNLTQRYASGQEYTYDMGDMAAFHRLYLRLLQHWHAVLPGRVLTVQYEDLVENPEREVRRLLDHCGLDYDARCLRFHETARHVATPSSEQVRQPLYREGIGIWRAFAPWLTPLERALGA